MGTKCKKDITQRRELHLRASGGDLVSPVKKLLMTAETIKEKDDALTQDQEQENEHEKQLDAIEADRVQKGGTSGEECDATKQNSAKAEPNCDVDTPMDDEDHNGTEKDTSTVEEGIITQKLATQEEGISEVEHTSEKEGLSAEEHASEDRLTIEEECQPINETAFADEKKQKDEEEEELRTAQEQAGANKSIANDGFGNRRRCEHHTTRR